MKRIILFALVLMVGLLTTCRDPINGDPDNPEQGATTIEFDNTQGICDVTVYSSYIRGEDNIIAQIPAGKLSQEFEWPPGSSMSFFFSYQIRFRGISGLTIDYIPEIGKDQKQVRVDPNIKNTIPIPRLDETISSPDTLLSKDSYLLIQNNSSYSLQLLQGNSILPQDNIGETVVNSGERAQYTINPGSTAHYKLMVGADTISLPTSMVSFEAGVVYSFVYNNGDLSLVSEIELKLENVAGVSPNKPVPEAPGAPLVIISDASLTVRWTAVNSAENYEVYLGTAQTPPNQPQRTVPGTTVVFSGLTNKTAYYVWVRAVNENGASDFSPRVRGIPWSANEAPATPGRPVIISGINQLTVTWEECGGASSYEVYINTTQSTSSATVITSEKTSAIINNLYNDVVYYLWVRAVNNAGKSNYSPEEAGSPQIPTAAPSAPDKPVLVARNKELAVSWQAVELAAAYEVWVGTTDNSAQAEKFGDDITGGVTETVITELINETTYYVWIKAKNIVGTSGFSSSANGTPSAFTVVPETPDTPTVIFGNRVLSISWQAVEGALFYEVWTSATGNSASAEKHGADVSGTSVIITDLNNGTTYYIWIKAKNNIGTSGFSHMTSGIPSASSEPPQAPESAPVVTAGNRELTISWQVVEGATAYELWAGTTINPTIASKKGDDVSALSAVITGLANGTTYYVWVKAKNSKGTSDFSPMASGTPSVFSVAPQAPSAPTVSIGNEELTVSWTAVESATAYEIWMGTSSNSVFAEKNGDDVAESELLFKTISGLSNGTVYYIWLKAKNNVGTSGFSPAASGTPIGNATIPTLTSSNNQLSVSWTAIAGADQYEVFFGTGVNPPQTAAQTVNTTSATITDLTNGTSYNVWVRGKNSTGTGAMSNAASAKPIGNMGTVTVTSGDEQLTVSWLAVAGADEYEIYYNTGNSIPATPAQTVSATTATISGINNGTTYYVWVKAKNANGAGVASASVSGVPMAAPGTPGSLTVSAADQQIAVSWAAVPGATSYQVYQSTTTTIPASPSDTVTGTSKTFTGLENGTAYYFWVKAVNAGGTSAASPQASGKPIGNMGAVTVTSGNEQLTVNWPAVAGADEYEVYHSTSTTIPGTASQTVSTTIATVGGLTNGATYYIWVKPKNSNGTGAVSASASGVPMAAPGNLTVSTAYQQITVSWASVLGATSYEVYQNTSTTIPASPSDTITETSKTFTGLTNGTMYYFWAKAVNANGTSGESPMANGTPRSTPDTPGTPTVASGFKQLLVTWTAVAGADEYEVYYGTGTTPTTLVTTTSETTATIIGLTNGTTYYVRLRAKNVNGFSGYGTTANSVPGSPGLYRGVEKISNQNLSDSLSHISSNAQTGDNFYIVLGTDETVSPMSSIYLYSGKTVGITVLGYGSERTITLASDGNMFYVNNGVTLTLDNNITLLGRNNGYGAALVQVNRGNLIINNGAKISKSGGSGVSIFNSGTVTMNGGTIRENMYGGIEIEGGTFIMDGGTISGNLRGIGVQSGTFTMNGGTISGNTTNGSGGGVYVRGGTFTMNGGTISGNTAADFGGGVYVILSGTFTMHGGTISGNTASSYSGGGGGVYVLSTGTFSKLPSGSINSGIIYGSEAIGNDANGVPLRNTTNATGHAIYYSSSQYRNTTAGQTDQLDTSTGRGLSANGNAPFGE